MGRRAPLLFAVSALIATGCASASAGPDLEAVRRLTDVPVIPEVSEPQASATVHADVKKLLGRPLDADAAVRVALLNNRMLRASLRQMGVARGQLIQAGLLPNPHVELEKPVEPEVRYEVGVELNLTQIVLAPLRHRAAAANLEAERYRAAGSVIDLGLEVRSAFFDAQAAEQRLTLARQSLDALAAARDAARALSAAGNAPTLSLASQEAAYERARVLVAAVELDVATARERLQRLMGLHGEDTAWTIGGRLRPVPERQPAGPTNGRTETRALEKSVILAETRSRLEAIARRSGLSRAQGWLPDVEIAGAAAQMAGGHEGEGSRRFGAGVTLSIPLFDRNQGTTAALAAEFDSLLERYHGTAVNVRSVARETEARLVSSHARARQYETVILPAQKRLTRETLLQFNAMQVGIFQLLLARREELDVDLAYVEALRDYWTAAARMEALLQGGSGGPLATTTAGAGTTISSSNASEGGH